MEAVGLKPAEVAPLLGYRSRSTVYELIATGQLKVIAGCRSIRISPDEVRAFAARAEARAKAEESAA